ncbi:G patch domain-containing protein 4 [Myripristis murdjan]|uniref:G patch domain-containing protein 4 n=1 Tax=Myripristis murdjan TaxID=586833 RepID=A0A667WWY3_9TELE|nr:G patch domain-containing protein 4 [Myripristis murdjan]
MAGTATEKSRGLKFAEQQLLRHGWEHGKGLGREENGISKAIKVKVKCDKGGVGHKQGEQFTFHWWDHVFNKASASLQVESDQNGVKVKKTVEEDDEGMISNKRPTKAALAKAKLYGCFVKSATLLSGEEQPEPKSSNSDDSSSSDDDDDDDEQLDLSSTTKLSDDDLMKACGGRTAHKGARHGLTMSAKLARLEQQEAEFMAKYGKKSQSAAASPVCVTPTTQSAAPSPERQEETAQASQSKKTKRKKPAGDVCENGAALNGEALSESSEVDIRPKKKKKKKKENSDEGIDPAPVGLSVEENLSSVETGGADRCQISKKKHKKKKKNAEEDGEASRCTTPSSNLEAAADVSSEADTDAKTKKKKKKKKKKSERHSEDAVAAESNDPEPGQSELVQDCAPKKKKRKGAITNEDAEVVEEDSAVKQRRKKCKADRQRTEDSVNKEAVPPKKKKKKSKE